MPGMRQLEHEAFLKELEQFAKDPESNPRLKKAFDDVKAEAKERDAERTKIRNEHLHEYECFHAGAVKAGLKEEENDEDFWSKTVESNLRAYVHFVVAYFRREGDTESAQRDEVDSRRESMMFWSGQKCGHEVHHERMRIAMQEAMEYSFRCVNEKKAKEDAGRSEEQG